MSTWDRCQVAGYQSKGCLGCQCCKLGISELIYIYVCVCVFWKQKINISTLAPTEVGVQVTRSDGNYLRSFVSRKKIGHAVACWQVCVLNVNTQGLAATSWCPVKLLALYDLSSCATTFWMLWVCFIFDFAIRDLLKNTMATKNWWMESAAQRTWCGDIVLNAAILCWLYALFSGAWRPMGMEPWRPRLELRNNHM